MRVLIWPTTMIERVDVEAGAAYEEVVCDHDAGDGAGQTRVTHEPAEDVVVEGGAAASRAS